MIEVRPKDNSLKNFRMLKFFLNIFFEKDIPETRMKIKQPTNS